MTDKQRIIDAFNSAWNRKVATESSYGKLASKEVFKNNNEDKQIIIDGIDVSGCWLYLADGSCTEGHFKWCKDNNYCYFKNWQLKQTLTEIKEVLQFYNNSKIGTDKGNGIFEFEVSNDNVLGGKLIYCYDTNPAKKALQKISEVENE